MPELCEPCGSCSISGKKVIVEKLTADLDRLMEQGAYADAYPVALRILEEAEALYGTQSADYASVLNDVASVERYLGRYGEAEDRFRAAARILRETRGELDSEYATTLNNLAGLHRLTGELEAAEAEFNDALRIYRRTLSASDWRTISCHNNLGLLYQDQGRFEEAMACHVEALQLLQGDDAPEDLSAVATTLMNGAICASKMGDAEEAEALFDYAMGLLEQIHGRRSAAFAGALNNVAAFRVSQGDAAGAVALLEESLETSGALFGRDSAAYRLVQGNLERARVQVTSPETGDAPRAQV